MKLTQVLLFLLIAAFQYSCNEKSDANGSITGTLSNASNIKVYIQSISESGETSLDSSTTDENGKFKMSNPVKELDYYIFRTDPGNVVFLILKGGENITINGDATALDASYELTGSKDSEMIRDLRRFEKKLGDSLNQVYLNIRNTNPEETESAGMKLQEFYVSTMQNFCIDFISNNMTSIASLSATKYLDQNKHLELMNSLGENLDNSFPGNKYVQDYIGLLAELKRLPIGSEAPEISLPSPDGKTISLSSLRGNVVLVDFWASWCGPCRKENPFIVSIYNKYKSKGFDVFGVSLDDNAQAWKDAIVKDNLKWQQVSELKKWNSEVAKLYGVEAIPFSVLLDREGKIIGKGLRGPDLENKIREALGINS